MSKGRQQPKFWACAYILSNTTYPTKISSYMQPVNEVVAGGDEGGSSVRTFWRKRVLGFVACFWT